MPHTWPVWGNKHINDYIGKYRDTIKYIHDQTLHLANQGYTMNEIGDMIKLPPALPITGPAAAITVLSATTPAPCITSILAITECTRRTYPYSRSGRDGTLRESAGRFCLCHQPGARSKQAR